MATFYTVLIIGSGVAGTSCAHQLAKTDISYLVLEGDDHTGGRTQTIHLGNENGNSDVDLGACFIHGADKNPLVNLCIENNIPFSFNLGDYEHCTFFSTNNQISYFERKKIEKYFYKIKKEVSNSIERER